MVCHFLLRGIFLTQGLNPGLLHCREILFCLSYQGSPSLNIGGRQSNHSVASGWASTLSVEGE